MSEFPAFSFSRDLRLVSQAQYKQVFAKKKKKYTPFFTIYFCKNTLGLPRLGIIVKKDKAKRAVVRNRIKRVVRETFRTEQQALCGLDIVVVAQHKAGLSEKVELRNQLKSFFQQLAESRS